MIDTYNGWSNYPTWCWKLWIDNDEGSYEYWREQTEDCIESSYDDDDAANCLRAQLESDADDRQAESAGNAGPICDILSWAMGAIDWREIADSMIEDVDDDERAALRKADHGDDDDDDDDAVSV